MQFDGIATNATIRVNDSVVAHNRSAHDSIEIGLTPSARFGDDHNVIAVRADADAMERWWYEGAGIYRHARLVRRTAVAIASDGIHRDPHRMWGMYGMSRWWRRWPVRTGFRQRSS